MKFKDFAKIGIIKTLNPIFKHINIELITREQSLSIKDDYQLFTNFYQKGLESYFSYSFDNFKETVLKYLESRKLNTPTNYSYSYSDTSTQPLLYNSIYAILIMSLFNEIKNLSFTEKEEWLKYFDNHQSPIDGLFYDKLLSSSENYLSIDWWGARHTALHIIIAYTALGRKPKYPFLFLKEYYGKERIDNWINSQDWRNIHNGDFDNQIMNIGVLLQYQRDNFDDKEAAESLSYLKKILINKISSETGLWSNTTIDATEKSRAATFSYHLFPLFTYDSNNFTNSKKVIDFLIGTQNSIGGFSPNLNSSACEDIDSIEPLYRFSCSNPTLREEISKSYHKALIWILSNQNENGGFVFYRNRPFEYGHELMYSKKNESNLFATWFRVLSIAYIDRFLHGDNSKFNFTDCPGLQFDNKL